MSNYQSSTKVVNSTFVANSPQNMGPATWGGGMYNGGSPAATVTNCTFVKNSGTMLGGGAMYNDQSAPTVANSIFWKNGYNTPIMSTSSLPSITYSFVEGGCAIETCTKDAVHYNIGETVDPAPPPDPMFVSTTDGSIDLNLVCTASPDCSPCVDTANNVVVDSPKDIAGNPRIVNGIIDMGAYENQ
jgi:hypothetical protein